MLYIRRARPGVLVIGAEKVGEFVQIGWAVCDTPVLELQLDVIHFHGNEAGNDAVDVSFHRGRSPGSIGARGTTDKIVSSLHVENDKRFRVMGRMRVHGEHDVQYIRLDVRGR